MHHGWNVCLLAALVGAACNFEDSNTVVVVGNTNGNVTSASAARTEGGGMEETDADEEDSGGDGGAASSDGSGEPDSTASSGEVDTTASSGEVDTTGDVDTTGEIDTTGGDAVCDPSLLLAMTPGCVPGTSIESAAWADAFCAQTFGAGWIWLEHHQQGGWYVEGMWIDNHGIGERGWIHVDDQPSACYQTDYGVTWVRAAFPDWQCRADCWTTIGLEGPEYNPQDGQKCNSYEGDTPCDHCRPLICARP